MKNKAVILAILFVLSNLRGLHSQNIVKIHNFFDETLNGRVSYVIALPFKSKYKKIKIKRSEVPAFQAYILRAQKNKIEMSLSISKNDINTELKLLEEAGGVLEKTDKNVRIIKKYDNINDAQGSYCAFILKEIKLHDLTYCLTLTLSGKTSILDKNFEKIIKSFDESSIVY